MSELKYHNKNQKIFSRNRITIPKIKYYRAGKSNKNYDFKIFKNKKLIKILLIFIVQVVVSRNIIGSINPIINAQCLSQARNIATLITNEQANVVMENYKYEDLAVVIKDDVGKIQMIKLNVIPVNEIISDVSVNIQNELNNVEDANLNLRLGSIFGMKILSGVGPNFNFKIASTGSVVTDIKSEFKSAGINQTLHQIYLDIECEIIVLTPYDSVSDKIKNQILIAESIIVGDIPNSYYNFDGANKSEALRAID